ncbi:androgen-induced gene 1 protein-like isoform X2 [Actinia tenebrosa]|uniref:Androgen-induced gene 1 protein-like isoform X2 n=1 Tax=Actinia tenebrosa TaxID=6105 RepID=A0A6P8HK25_ACTTE|nr:androgen-induced gene 1 protein-like isoform X2 [Actinia tenebrosa]
MAEGNHRERVFHFIFATFFCILLYYDLKLLPPGVILYGGRWKYLTFINLVFQVTFFVFASFGDIVTFFRGQETNWIISIRDTMFAAIVFPCGVFVTATFWGIYFVDRELVYPKILDDIIPTWINHGLHTWVAVSVILEGAIVRHRYPRNVVGLFFALLFQVIYLSWISYIAYTQDFWVYPFLRLMENSARTAFFGLCALVLVFFYFMGKGMNRVIWEGEEAKITAQEKKNASKRKAKKVE